MAPKAKQWQLDDHTKGKHVVLEEYLKVWFPVTAISEDRLLFIDGFAGPGRYSGGEEGSPLIALRVFLTHRARAGFRGKPYFLFIEEDKGRAEQLDGEVSAMLGADPSPPKADVVVGTFHEGVESVRQWLGEDKKQLAPAFVMVDPFGVSDTPMVDLHWLLASPKCEIYVSVMIPYIQRFVGTPEFEPHLDALFGVTTWRDIIDLPFQERREKLTDLYEARLRAAPQARVVRFDLYGGGKYKYTIFHASKHAKSCATMKAAIWKIDPSGGFAFRGSVVGQQLGLPFANGGSAALHQFLLGQLPANQWTGVDALNDALSSDSTPFHPGQLKAALREMEGAGTIEVLDGSRKKKRTYPNGVKLRSS